MTNVQGISFRWRRRAHFAKITTIILVLTLLANKITPRASEEGNNSTEKSTKKPLSDQLTSRANRAKFELRYNERPRRWQKDLVSEYDIELQETPCMNHSEPTCHFRRTCGQAPLNSLTPKSRGYVVNGQDEVYGEWPAFAKLDFYDSSVPISMTCGGTLVTDRHVITAAHCVYQRNGLPPKLIEPRDIRVYLAKHDVWEMNEFEKEFNVKHVCASTKYTQHESSNQTHDDWAVLELEERATFNDHIQPACLPFDPIKRTGRSSTCFLVGAGVVKSHSGELETPALIVQKLRVEQVSCRAWLLHDRDASRECYTKLGSHDGDSCGGDSGGPVMCLDDKRRWTLAATVSFGTENCNEEEKERAWVGVYSRMRTLLSEIKEACHI